MGDAGQNLLLANHNVLLGALQCGALVGAISGWRWNRVWSVAGFPVGEIVNYFDCIFQAMHLDKLTQRQVIDIG